MVIQGVPGSHGNTRGSHDNTWMILGLKVILGVLGSHSNIYRGFHSMVTS